MSLGRFFKKAFKDVGRVVKDAGAPLLGAVLTGGSVNALGLVAKAIGLPMGSDAHEVHKQLSANPDLLVKMKEIENAHELDLRRERVKELENARNSSVEYSKSKNLAYQLMVPAMVLLITLLFLAMIFILVKVNIPTENKMLFSAACGAIMSRFEQICSFLFGSSQGSKDKSGQIDQIIDKG